MLLRLLVVAALDCAVVRVSQIAPGEIMAGTTLGKGSQVVIIPGMLCAGFGYRKMIEPLTSAGHRVIVLDPLGTGKSSRPADADYSLTAQADRLAAALDTLEVRQAVLVAHTIGASMALRLAYRRPDLVRGVVSVAGGPVEQQATPIMRLALRLGPLIKTPVGRKLVRLELRKLLLKSSGDTTWVTNDVVDAYSASVQDDLDGTLRAMRAMASSSEPQSLRENLGAIRAPVRLLVGTAPRTGGITSEEVDLLSQLVPDFAIDSIRGAGLFIQEEKPAAVVGAVAGLMQATAKN